MLIQPYQLDELKFAWCYRVYYRWRTHRAGPQPALAQLDKATLDAMLQPYDIHVLEATASETDVKMLASLLPDETVAAGRQGQRTRQQMAARTTPSGRTAEAPQPRLLRLHRGKVHCRSRRTLSGTAERTSRIRLPRESAGVRPALSDHPGRRTTAERPARRDDPAASSCVVHVATQGRLRTSGRRSCRHTLATDAGRIDDGSGKGLVRCGSCPLGGAHPSECVTGQDGGRPDERGAGSALEGFPRIGYLRGSRTALAAQRHIGAYGDLESAKIAAYVRRWEDEAAE